MTDSPLIDFPLATRLASSTDTPALVRLINASFIVEQFFVSGDRISSAEVAPLLERGSFLVIDAANGVLTACVYVERRGEGAYLGLLSVDPGRQKQGIGTALLRAAEQHCGRLGCRTMEIRVVNVREELLPYYEKHGYRAYATEPFSTPERATRPCHFVLMSKLI
jgi:GNAT superfamily N-acetyltransferase